MEQRAGRLNELKRDTMTVHSNDRLTGNTKLDSIRRRAEGNPETVFNNLGHVITEELLYQGYQEQDEKKAVGIDKVTKEAYGKELKDNISDLIQRIRRKQYKPQASRIVEIPKENGDFRPLAISCFEDKLVQWTVSKILEQIYEPVFLPSSFGFRPNRSCHDALRALMQHTYQFRDGAVIEIDIRKCFNMIPHVPLMDILKLKISDTRFLQLVETLITAPILEDGKPVNSTRGCPQGSVCSPIISNIFLHHVVDVWFETIKKTHMKGRAELVRYADDMVFVFEYAADAKRFYAVLGKRLNKFGLELHEGKSGIWPSGEKAAQRAAKAGERIPTYVFLGFTCYWGKSRKGFWRLKYTSRQDRFTAKLKELRAFIWKNKTVEDTDDLLRRIIRVVRGWINYHAISDNQKRVSSFLLQVKKLIFKWINRRGCNRASNWENLIRRLKRVGYPESFKTKSMFA